MKFEISTLVLKNALNVVNHATANITTTPILENILIKVNYKNIVFISNNLEMAIEYVINDDIKIESEGSFCVPSKIFTNYITLLDDDFVGIELLNDSSIEIKTQSSNIKIKGNASEDFPVIPLIKEEISFKLNSNIIKKSIEKTLFSAASGNIRPTLAGIFIKLDGFMAKFATTDSFRLSEYKTKIDNEINQTFSQIIPSKTAYELRSILDDKVEVDVKVGENQILFIFGNTKFYSRLLNGKFPDYEVFFPSIFNAKTVVNRVDLIQALKKINLLSKENNYSIKISFSKTSGILIETSQTQIGEAKVYLVGSVDGDESIVGLNSEYLLEVLGVIETTHVNISFESPLSPIYISGINDDDNGINNDFRHIIMPLKI